MNLRDFAEQLQEKRREVETFLASDRAKDLIGTEAVRHYKESFDREGFTDEVFNPWKDVKRRDPSSPWYGHSGQTGRFSPERTKAPILSGETGLLRDSIRFTYIPGGVRVSNSVPYAAVHQYGLPAKVYGKAPFKMPARPFIGKSRLLKRTIETKIKDHIIDIIKR